jgi:ribosomal-protein-alanine N-acetyltransferase
VTPAIRDYHPDDFDTLWQLDQECFPPGIAYSRQELGTYIRNRATFTLVATENVASVERTLLPAGAIKKVGHEHHPPRSNTTSKSSQESSPNEVQGFIVVHRAATGHVITIDVKTEARRSGVGSLLLKAAEQRLLEAGCQSVGLETAVDNVTALKFYKRHGYTVIRTWPRYYPNGVDAFVLKKELS